MSERAGTLLARSAAPPTATTASLRNGAAASPGARRPVTSRPTDPHEREADRLAERVVRLAGRPTAAAIGGGDWDGQGAAAPAESRARRAAVPPGPAGGPTTPGPGRPLERSFRRWAEPAMGRDLSAVRVHDGPAAVAAAGDLGAAAYTVGSHIVMGAGRPGPDSPAERRLLAHELAHVLQGNTVPHRVPLVPATPAAEPEPPAGEAAPAGPPRVEEALETEVTDTGTDVVRVLISCADRLINFRTPTDNYTYRLTACQIPVGSYRTTIRRDGADVVFDFGEQVTGEVFRFRYYVAAGRTDPTDLFQTGDSVTIDVVASLQTATAPTGGGCVLRFDDRELFEEWRPDPIELFPAFSRDITLWAHVIPLGVYGWVDVTLSAAARGSGAIDVRAGPGRLVDVCLLQRIDDRRVGGHARFVADASITPWIDLGGDLDLSARYLSIIPALSVSGGLDARGEIALTGAADAEVQVLYDHDSDEWEATAAVALTAGADLRFRLTAHALIESLTIDLWREDWTLADAETGFAWRGGLRIGPRLRPTPQIAVDAGSLGVQAGGGGGAGGAGGGGGAPGAAAGTGGGISVDQAVAAVTGLLAAVLAFDAGTSTPQDPDFAVTGARDTPIPMVWYKPPPEYLRAIILPDEDTFRFGDAPRDYILPDPEIVRTGRGAADLRRMPSYQQNGVARLGVAAANIPTQDRIDRQDPGLVWKKGRSYRQALGAGPQRALRFLLAAHGVALSGLDADHVRDLQFGGSDDFDNMWLLDERINRSNQRFADQDVTYNDASGAVVTTTLDDPALLGKHFRIVGLHLF